MAKIIFPDDFKWGTATASFQIEGAHNEDGKGESIWDRFCHLPGNVVNGDTGDVACDHYHLYENDIKLMKELGITSYRLSTSWPRIFPDGKGKANEKGLDFYKRLLNQLLDNGISPAVTLYHWDLPQKLQDIGGWTNRDITDYYEQYAECLFKNFGDIVPSWITHNEPWVVSFMGNWLGTHAPGLRDLKAAVQVSHNLLLSHGKAVNLYRNLGYKGEIGITLNMSHFYPDSDSELDVEAAKRNDGFHNRWFSDPVLKGKYPEDILKLFEKKGVLPDINFDDLAVISTPVDFIGLNYYSSGRTKDDPTNWPLETKGISMGVDKTDMGWEIYPEGLHDLLVKLKNEYGNIKIYITENGAAFNDIVNREGKVEDDNRLDFLHRHFVQAHRAIQSGVNLAGYYVWSLMDNFEWAEGYSKRFGLIYVDYKTRQRIIKKSGHWYKQVISSKGLEV